MNKLKNVFSIHKHAFLKALIMNKNDKKKALMKKKHNLIR